MKEESLIGYLDEDEKEEKRIEHGTKLDERIYKVSNSCMYACMRVHITQSAVYIYTITMFQK